MENIFSISLGEVNWKIMLLLAVLSKVACFFGFCASPAPQKDYPFCFNFADFEEQGK
jgi:hypothetical protein